MASLQQSQSSVPEMKTPEREGRKIIGIYGLPGAGKSTLLKLLKSKLDQAHFAFYEGSELIASIVPDGLEAFKTLNDEQKLYWRQQAIRKAKEHASSERAVVIAGHYMFWDDEAEAAHPIMTQDDLDVYTHILYIDVPAKRIAARRQQDRQNKIRDRPDCSASHLDKWQQTEKTELRQRCYDNGILFSVVSEVPRFQDKVSQLLQDFRSNTKFKNQSLATVALDNVFAGSNQQPKNLLVFDGDKTLTPVDTGEIFWKEASKMLVSTMEEDPLKMIFGSSMNYTYTAFRQAMLLYEESFNEQQFNKICEKVAAMTQMYPEFLSLLQAVVEQDNAHAVIITCGLRRVWENILERQGFSDKIKVIGGGRLADGFVVTAETKAELVCHAKHAHSAFVCAFGDSPLDLGMLKKVDRAIVVVGEEGSRSKSMDTALSEAIEKGGLRAHQVVLGSKASPRLSPKQLPETQLTGSELVHDILRLQPRCAALHLTHATNTNAGKLLSTPTRDAGTIGPSLRGAHQLVGRYLATSLLSEIHGLEMYMIPHVQGNETVGYRILHEDKTLIVPLMRGGEPMAFGVNEVLPNAMFHHAKVPEDLAPQHLRGRLSIILVDSVVNTGKSILEFVRHIRKMHATIRIIVVAGVVQKGAVSILENEACCRFNFKIIALRLSENQYTGKGGTDTGHRLFNTRHLD